MNDSLPQLVTDYVSHFTSEREEQASLLARAATDNDIFNRKNMAGHVTSSALVLNAAGTHTLLIHHNSQQLWLQPGGHCDAEDESLLAAALREVREETGLSGLTLHPWHDTYPFPFDFHTHPIAARPAKGEGAHRHHDAIWLVQTTDDSAMTLQLEEIGDARWFPLAEIVGLDGLRLKKIHAKLEAEALAQPLMTAP